jgi:hypothetical protein
MEQINQWPVYAFDCHIDGNTLHWHENKFCVFFMDDLILTL